MFRNVIFFFVSYKNKYIYLRITFEINVVFNVGLFKKLKQN